jgi:hypothetical protein
MLERGRSGRAKLTPMEVREIRGLCLAGADLHEVARRYPVVGVQQVRSIAQGRSWAGV